ncbi:MAG: HNH endonuclease signature motif containing protein, partial [Candidatus Curtissbacteria bacterium]|nr:HNH endonuclease signature motif containing protein [Candidatus Curtissbacteria bacterium]
MNKETIELIVKLYNSGLSIVKAGEKLNLSPAIVRYWLKKANVKFRKSGFRKGNTLWKKNVKEIDLKSAISLYFSGLTIAEVGKKLNIPHTTVWKKLRKVGIKFRKRGFKEGSTSWIKGKTRSLEQRRKQSETRKRLFAEGKLIHSEETRRKMSISQGGNGLLSKPKIKKEKIIKKCKPKQPKKYYYQPYSVKYKNGIEKKRFTNQRYKARKRNAVGSHTFEQWQKLKEKFNYMCLCCKRFEPEIKLTEDHIVPLSMGGTDYIDNIHPLCQCCYTRKHAKFIYYLPIINDFDSFINNQLTI